MEIVLNGTFLKGRQLLFKETLVILKEPWKHYIHGAETNKIHCFVHSFKVRLYVDSVMSININVDSTCIISIKNLIIL